MSSWGEGMPDCSRSFRPACAWARTRTHSAAAIAYGRNHAVMRTEVRAPVVSGASLAPRPGRKFLAANGIVFPMQLTLLLPCSLFAPDVSGTKGIQAGGIG